MEVDDSTSPFTNVKQKNGNSFLPQPVDIEKNGAKGNGGGYSSRNTLNSPTIQYIRKRGLPWILVILSVLVITLFVILCVLLLNGFSTSEGRIALANFKLWPSSASVLARFRSVAVVSDNGLCSEIGRSVLMRGGNAVDAAIAVDVCVGALNGHSSGIGGGFLMVFYNRFYRKCSTVDARETAPLATNEKTFVANPKDAFTGYKSIGVPGEVAGLWHAYKRFGSGKVNWFDLLRPTVQLLNDGYPVSALMERSLRARNGQLLTVPSMKEFFTNKATGELYKEGEILQNPELAKTLHKLATSSDPIALFYRGDIAAQIAKEMRENDAYITQKDLEKYAIVSDAGMESDALADASPGETLTMCGMRAPSSFPITQLIVHIVARFFPSPRNSSVPHTSADYYHKFIEAQKFAFALRSQLGDAKFAESSNELIENMTKPEMINEIFKRIGAHTLPSAVDYDLYRKMNAQPDDHGTSHISIVDADGNAVSLTSSVNNVFGAMLRSNETGIIWNDGMDDFSIPGTKNFFGFEPSEANFVAPGKRSMSSMSPLIVYDKDSKNVRLSIGASGGSKIISAVSQVLLQTLLFNSTVKEAIDMPRIHNQFTPFYTEFEEKFPETIVDELRQRGQNMTPMVFPFANVHAILRDKTMLNANSDYRRAVYTYPTGY